MWYACRHPQSRFLQPDGAAQWIHYPVPPQVVIVTDRCEQHAVFRRTFELPAAPEWARLRVRAFKSGSIWINGRSIVLPESEHWNQVRSADVAAHLRAGVNKVHAVVANHAGPPVLWLALNGPGWSVASDDQWRVSLDGATETAAHQAGQPLPIRSGNPAAGGNHTGSSFQARAGTLLGFALLSAGIILVGHFVARRPAVLQLFGNGQSTLWLALLAVGLLWIVLFIQNTLRAPLFVTGFDVQAHLNYIKYIQQHKSLPLADEGWETHQPPLYYLLTAGLLGVGGLSTEDPGALVVLRGLGLVIGLGQLVLVAASLALLFPGQPRRQLAGLCLAAFLPVSIYTCHYLTNESLLMLLGTAALYLCLGILRDDHASAGRHALLGLCLAAALLTKVTALVICGVILIVLSGRLVIRRERRLSHWLGSVGVALLVMVLVSGWHYARVWARFGTPFVGNYDAASGFVFWQDPGYGTLAYLVHFGQSLTQPFFCALQSLPDGLYSTFWGDGLCGGVSILWSYRPPWNYDVMAAGYLLALLPSLGILMGVGLSLVELVRRPRTEWFLLCGVGVGLGLALLYQFVRYPYYGHAKAMYELTVMLSICTFGAWGLDLLARSSRLAGFCVAIAMGTWACTTYASYWICPDCAATLNWAGLQQLSMNQYVKAETCFRMATEADPHAVAARLNQAAMRLRAHEPAAARQLIEMARRDDPENPDALFALAYLFQAEGRVSECLHHLRQVAELAPDHPAVHSVLGATLMRQNQRREAIAAYREAVRVSPSNPSDHATLGLLLAQTGAIEEALGQYWRALGLRPAQSDWVADLAWILATQLPPPRLLPYDSVSTGAVDEKLHTGAG
jgi:Flp pilus assembly protein TadD